MCNLRELICCVPQVSLQFAWDCRKMGDHELSKSPNKFNYARPGISLSAGHILVGHKKIVPHAPSCQLLRTLWPCEYSYCNDFVSESGAAGMFTAICSLYMTKILSVSQGNIAYYHDSAVILLLKVEPECSLQYGCYTWQKYCLRLSEISPIVMVLQWFRYWKWCRNSHCNMVIVYDKNIAQGIVKYYCPVSKCKKPQPTQHLQFIHMIAPNLLSTLPFVWLQISVSPIVTRRSSTMLTITIVTFCDIMH